MNESLAFKKLRMRSNSEKQKNSKEIQRFSEEGIFRDSIGIEFQEVNGQQCQMQRRGPYSIFNLLQNAKVLIGDTLQWLL